MYLSKSKTVLFELYGFTSKQMTTIRFNLTQVQEHTLKLKLIHPFRFQLKDSPFCNRTEKKSF